MNIENIPTLRVDIEKVGPQGFSAYEIYLQGGGTLSETEWLESLKGETGATPDVQAGETITLQPEEQAKVTRTGTIENPVFTFAIPQGKEGVQGIRGPEGKQGIQGPEGKAGEDGKSAYQIWLDQGNEGTEQDFLNSLVGPEGTGGISLEEVKEITGELENLETEDKTNLVNAVNEVFSGLENAGGIPELTANTNLYEMPYGVYKVSSEKTFINVRIATSGSWKNFVAVGGSLIFWCKMHYGTGYSALPVAFYFTASDTTHNNLMLYIYKVVGGVANGRMDVNLNFSSFATKSYVDTAITNAITTVLEGEY